MFFWDRFWDRSDTMERSLSPTTALPSPRAWPLTKGGNRVPKSEVCPNQSRQRHLQGQRQKVGPVAILRSACSKQAPRPAASHMFCSGSGSSTGGGGSSGTVCGSGCATACGSSSSTVGPLIGFADMLDGVVRPSRSATVEVGSQHALCISCGKSRVVSRITFRHGGPGLEYHCVSCGGGSRCLTTGCSGGGRGAAEHPKSGRHRRAPRPPHKPRRRLALPDHGLCSRTAPVSTCCYLPSLMLSS